MTKPAENDVNELLAFRQQIDAIDDKLIALFEQRIGIVKKVGELKKRTQPGQCPIRAGREAEMVAGIIEKCRNGAFPPAAAAAIWRLLIGASTSVEASLKISAYATDNDAPLYWLAREYFGPFLNVSRQTHVKRVIGDVMDGKAAVGIVPILHSNDNTYWWTNLVQPGNDIPKIFAHIPFVHYGQPAHDAPRGFAIARVKPEPSGNDITIVVLEADHNVSQHKLQGAFTQASLEPNWINVATISPSTRHHLLEIKGFVTESDAAIQTLKNQLGNAVFQLTILGSYAVPIALKNADTTNQSTGQSHVIATAKA